MAVMGSNEILEASAILTKAILRAANLSGATASASQLAQAKSLAGATMPDGVVHE